MAKIIFEHMESELPDGSDIFEVCDDAGIPFACTEGCCGTCVIQVVEGMENLSEVCDAEEDFFGDITDERLACQCKIKSGEVKVKF